MPRTKQHASNAKKQMAYRDRCRARTKPLPLVTTGLPTLPASLALPGTKRWQQGIAQAHELLELVQQEMQNYYDQRSEKWQESEKGDAFQERLDAITEVAAHIDELTI